MWEKEQLTQPYTICNPDHQRQAPDLLTLAEAPKLLNRGYMVFFRPKKRTYVGLKLQTSPMPFLDACTCYDDWMTVS